MSKPEINRYSPKKKKKPRDQPMMNIRLSRVIKTSNCKRERRRKQNTYS